MRQMMKSNLSFDPTFEPANLGFFLLCKTSGGFNFKKMWIKSQFETKKGSQNVEKLHCCDPFSKMKESN